MAAIETQADKTGIELIDNADEGLIEIGNDLGEEFPIVTPEGFNNSDAFMVESMVPFAGTVSKLGGVYVKDPEHSPWDERRLCVNFKRSASGGSDAMRKIREWVDYVGLVIEGDVRKVTIYAPDEDE